MQGVANKDWISKRVAAAIVGCDEGTIGRVLVAGGVRRREIPGLLVRWSRTDVERIVARGGEGREARRSGPQPGGGGAANTGGPSTAKSRTCGGALGLLPTMLHLRGRHLLPDWTANLTRPGARAVSNAEPRESRLRRGGEPHIHRMRAGDVARDAADLGLVVVPPKEDGTKAPLVPWKRYRDDPPSAEQIDRWYGPRTGVGFVCGAVSDDLELFELDADFYDEFKATAEAVGLRPLLSRIESGYLERSPGGGWHLLFRCPEAGASPSTKLARRLKTPDEFNDDDRAAIARAAAAGREHKPVQTLIETKGEGGYVVIAPSNGKVHPNGGRYVLLKGGPATIAAISAAERAALWDLARTFDRMPAAPQTEATPRPKARDDAPPSAGGLGLRPGDDFNARDSWDGLMEGWGWSRVFVRGEATYWRRPGKSEGWSATTNHAGSGLLWVFTSSSAFEQGRSYDKFGAFVAYEFGGDYRGAAKALRERGYGETKGRGHAFSKGPKEAAESGLVPNRADGSGGGGAFSKVPGEPSRNFPLTDLGNAERLVARHGDDLRYCHCLAGVRVAGMGPAPMGDRQHGRGEEAGQANGQDDLSGGGYRDGRSTPSGAGEVGIHQRETGQDPGDALARRIGGSASRSCRLRKTHG